MKKLEDKVIIRDALGATPYWAADENVMKAVARFKRLSGRYPSESASIKIFTGTPEDLDKIEIDDLGDIHYPKTIERVVTAQ